MMYAKLCLHDCRTLSVYCGHADFDEKHIHEKYRDYYCVCLVILTNKLLYYFVQMMAGTPSWERMPLDVAGEVMDQMKGDKEASAAVFRTVCIGWRDAHDQGVTRLNVTRESTLLPCWSDMLRTRFPGVKTI
jgi:hypothetical protein